MVGDPLRTDTNAEAPAAFVGYGVTAPKFGYDDYAGADVRGKIVVALYGAPPSFPSAPGAYYSDSIVKLQNAAAHGAIGVLTIWGGRVEERTPFSELVRFYHEPTMRWLDAKDVPNDVEPKIRARATISSGAATAMLEGSGKSWKEVVSTALNSKPQAFPLTVSVSLHVASRHSAAESPNIAAILPGSDPQLKNEYVVLPRTPTTWESAFRSMEIISTTELATMHPAPPHSRDCPRLHPAAATTSPLTAVYRGHRRRRRSAGLGLLRPQSNRANLANHR